MESASQYAAAKMTSPKRPNSILPLGGFSPSFSLLISDIVLENLICLNALKNKKQEYYSKNDNGVEKRAKRYRKREGDAAAHNVYKQQLGKL